MLRDSSRYLSKLRPALMALLSMAARAIWDGGNSSPASVMAAWVRKSSELFLNDSGFSSVGNRVCDDVEEREELTKRGQRIRGFSVSPPAKQPWGQWAAPPGVCRGCGRPGESWAVGWAEVRTPGSAPEPSPAPPGSPEPGCPQTGCWTHWTHPLYRTGTHTSTWEKTMAWYHIITIKSMLFL